jgi:hypothetical protein
MLPRGSHPRYGGIIATEYGYVITQQTQGTELDPMGGRFIPVWNIAYKVTAGPAANAMGVVQVTEDQHNAAAVKALIEAKIKALSDVASLGR